MNEVGSSVNVLDWDAKKGVFTTKQLISTVPADNTGPTAPSDIVMDKKGKFAYVEPAGAERLYGLVLDFSE